jgi:hypothetical protein
MKNLLLLILAFISFKALICMSKLKRFTNYELAKIERNKEKIGFIYINPNNMSHNFFMEELYNYLQIKPLKNYSFGYLDLENDQRLLEYFKIKNRRDSGLILYNFANKNYYVEEGLNHMKDIQDIFEKVENGKLNWSSNSIIEKIFFLITGKRYGKEAHSMFSFGICLISIIVYTIVNIKARREERRLIEEKLKSK